MINRNVIGVAACTLGLLFSPITNIKVNAQTLTPVATATQIEGSVEEIEESKMNPDMKMSDEELKNKYAGKTYREVKSIYEKEGYIENELKMIAEKVDSLRNTMPITITDQEKDLLYRLVYSEGGNQPYETQQYICSVVLNRVRSPLYDNSVSGVIYAPFQFSVVSNGMIDWKIPTPLTIDAVNDVLENGVTNGRITSFRNDYYHYGLQDEFVSGILYFSSNPMTY